MEPSFELNDYHIKVFVVNKHDREFTIQGDFNFFGGNSGEVIDHEASNSHMLMIETFKMIVNRNSCWSSKS